MNTLLASIINMVYTETNRPDLVPDTLQAVLAATLDCHTIDFFPKDLVGSQIQFDTPAYIQVLDTSAIPLYRALSFLRKNDPSFALQQQNPYYSPSNTYTDIFGYSLTINQVMAPIEIIEPDEIFDDFSTERFDVAYQAGTSINIRSSTLLQFIQAGWYAYPNVNPDNYNSWIAMESPYSIVYKAAAVIFGNTGDSDSMSAILNPNTGRLMNNKMTGTLDILIRNNILTRGR